MITERDADYIRAGDPVFVVSNKGRGVFEWRVLSLNLAASELVAKSLGTGEVRTWPLSCLFWNTADAFDAHERVLSCK